MILERAFYLREDVQEIARGLLGKYLVTRIGGEITSGIICETEAYAGVTDRASHAFGGRKTSRNGVMYGQGGLAYVYLCYGIHSLFNVVTNREGIPHAILIRGIEPADGIPVMLKRSGKKSLETGSGIGPGKLSTLLGIHYAHSGIDLTRGASQKQDPAIWIEDRGTEIQPSRILTGPRIGIAYAGEDALLPYRYRVNDL